MLNRSKEEVESGLFRAFNHIEYYNGLKNDVSTIVLDRFIFLAYKKGLIKQKSKDDFENYLASNIYRVKNNLNSIDDGFTFSDFINIINTKKGTTGFLVGELNKIADFLSMKKVNKTMVTRLKQNFNINTKSTRNFIRILCLWLGFKSNQDLFEIQWNYEQIVDLSRININKSTIDMNEGVRIVFSLRCNDEIIGLKDVKWLKKEINQTIQDLNINFENNHLIEYNITTVYIDLPKETGPSGEPRLYNAIIHDSFKIAHQMSARWILSKFSTPYKKIVISISAGQFINLMPVAQVLLNSIIPEDILFIRVNDFARLCAQLSDIKVNFSSKPIFFQQPDGSAFSLWWVHSFRSHVYFNFILPLLDQKYIPNTQDKFYEFRQSLKLKTNSEYKAVTIMQKFPDNPHILIEIAKVCFSRKMFREANEIISNILVYDPLYVEARSFRILIYINLANKEPSFSMKEIYHSLAVEESRFIEKHTIITEDTLCDIGLAFFNRAINILYRLRSHEQVYDLNEQLITKKNVIGSLSDAENCFRKGIIISQTAYRSYFWFTLTKSLKKILLGDSKLFIGETKLADNKNICQETCLEIFNVLGWIPELSSENVNKQIQDATTILLTTLDSHLNAVDFQLTHINRLGCFAIILWDFIPILTVKLAKKVLQFLGKAETNAQKMLTENIGIFSILQGSVESPEHFIKQVCHITHKIKSLIKDDLLQDDDSLISNEIRSKFNIFLYIIEYNQTAFDEILFKN